MDISNELIAIELMKMCNGDFSKKKKLVKAYHDFLEELEEPKGGLFISCKKVTRKRKRK